MDAHENLRLRKEKQQGICFQEALGLVFVCFTIWLLSGPGMDLFSHVVEWLAL
jgi:hypothetical protein